MISHKKKTIATWCLATVASTCLALSGVFYNAPMKASAEGLVQLETQNLISDVSSGVTVTANKSVNAASVTGLAVESESAYEGALNATFTGDLALGFIFPGAGANGGTDAGTQGDGNGAFQFIISDAEDSSKFFTINYVPQQVGTTWERVVSYVEYNDGTSNYVRTWNHSSGRGDKWVSSLNTLYDGYKQVAAFNNGTAEQNKLTFDWIDDPNTEEADQSVLTVSYQAKGRWGAAETKTMIAFDGQTGELSGTVCAVPKISFENGYKISFKSTYGTGTDVCFTSIGDVSLAADAVDANVSTVEGSYLVNGEEIANGDTVIVEKGTELSVSGESVYTLMGLGSACDDVTVACAGVAVEYTGTYNKDVAGQYTLNVGDFAFTVNVKNAYKVQYSVNGELGNAQILDTENATITLADAPAAVEGKTFIGWSTAANVLYPAGVEYTVSGNVTITAVYMDMQMVAGASIRKSNPSGIRFSTKIAESDYNENYMTEMGTLIIPTDMLAGKAFTVEGLNGATHLNIVRTTWLSADSISGLKIANTDGYKLYAGVMTTVQQGNYTRDFSARGYVKVSYADETSVYFYTNYSETDNVRSVYEVATKSLDANEADTNGELSKIVNNVADITVTSDGSGFTVAKTNENATYTVSGSVDANGAASVTVNGNVQTLVVNGVNIFSETAVSVLVSETAYSLENAKIVNGEGTATITFDLGDAALQAALNGKTISFIGDSITTYKGISKCNNPWYGNTEASRGNTTMLYADTWWAQLMEGYGMELEANHSTGAISVVDRAVSHYGDVGSPDIVVVFMGTNDKDNFTIRNKEFTDFITSSNVEETLARAEKLVVGNQYAQWYNYSNETFNLDSFTFADAYYVMLRAIKAKNPNAKLVLVTTYAGEEVAAKNAVIKGFAEHFGAAVVDLENTELKTSVESDYALMDKENSVHPNEAGMDIITEAVADALRALYVEE